MFLCVGFACFLSSSKGNAEIMLRPEKIGAIINVTRDLGSRFLTRLPADNPLDKQYAVRLIQTFTVALNYHLTDDGMERGDFYSS